MERDRVKMKFFRRYHVPVAEAAEADHGKPNGFSARFEGVQVNMCVNYGGRDEILRAARAYAQEYKEKGTPLTEEKFSGYMFFGG